MAKHRQAALVKDVRADSRYIAYFANTLSEVCVPLLDKDGGVLGVLNVESRKKTFAWKEVQKLEILADLAVIAIQNAESKKKLSSMEIMATLGDLTSQLLHRMKPDIGALKVILRETINSFSGGNIEYARDKAKQMQYLIDRVSRNLGRMKAWEQEEPKYINLWQVMSEALKQVQIRSGVSLCMDIPTSLPEVLGGEQQLVGVFDNLIQNAIDAMPNGGTLSINGTSVERETHLWIEVIVSDTGSGIAKGNLERIFQLGFTTKNDQGNMGFGLWWTQIQIESLGGQLVVNSEVGRGSKFTVILPAHKLETKSKLNRRVSTKYQQQ